MSRAISREIWCGILERISLPVDLAKIEGEEEFGGIFMSSSGGMTCGLCVGGEIMVYAVESWAGVFVAGDSFIEEHNLYNGITGIHLNFFLTGIGDNRAYFGTKIRIDDTDGNIDVVLGFDIRTRSNITIKTRRYGHSKT